MCVKISWSELIKNKDSKPYPYLIIDKTKTTFATPKLVL
jgi:hypothetical protein